MEKKRPKLVKDKDQEGLHLIFDGGLQVIRGSTDLTQISLNQHIQYISGIHEPFLQINLGYGQKNETAFLDQLFAHLRWTAMWWDHWGTELFSQVQEDAFQALVIRSLNGLGVRSLFYVEGKLEAALGLGYMYEYEVYKQNQKQVEEFNHRMTSYLTWTYRLKPSTLSPLNSKQAGQSKQNLKSKTASSFFSATLYNTTYFQPQIGDWDDFRILNDLSLEIRFTSWLAFVESLNLFYDHQPPQGISPYNLNSMSKIRLSW